MSLEIKIVKNYAHSLLIQARNVSIEKKIIEEVKIFWHCLCESKNFEKVMLSPIINKSQKNNIIESIAGKLKFHDLTKYFLNALVKNFRINLLPDIINEIELIYKEQIGIKLVNISSVTNFKEDELDVIKNYFEKSLNTKIEINQEIDKSLLGGIVIKYDSKLIDFSVSGALSKIEKIITHAR